MPLPVHPDAPRRRVALFCQSLASTGGVERAFASLSDVLAEHFDVWAISLDPPGTVRSFSSRSIFRPIGPSLGLPLPFRAISYALDAFRLWRVKRELRIDVTISSLWRADLISILSGGMDRKISLCQINIVGNDTNRLLILLRPVAVWIYRRFSHVVACSTPLRAEVQELFRLQAAKSSVIYNVVPPVSPPASRPNNGRIRMVFCGRFVREKNALALVEIYALARSIDPALQLIMIGDGPLRGAVDSLIAARQLRRADGIGDPAGDVILTGFVPNSASLVAQCDFQVVPSVAEGIPLTLIEGLSAGLPAIVSDFGGGGAREALGVGDEYAAQRPAGAHWAQEADCAVLLPVPELDQPESIAIWRDHVLRMAADEGLRRRLGEAARARARLFQPDVVAPKWRRLLDDLG